MRFENTLNILLHTDQDIFSSIELKNLFQKGMKVKIEDKYCIFYRNTKVLIDEEVSIVKLFKNDEPQTVILDPQAIKEPTELEDILDSLSFLEIISA